MLLSKHEMLRMVVDACIKHNLEPQVVCAFIDVQSQWRPGNAEYTPIDYQHNMAYPDPQEGQFRAMRWGLMGIQGEFARQNGYNGRLKDLLDPNVNISFGCELLAKLYTNGLINALLAWNNLHDRAIVRETLVKAKEYEELLQRLADCPPTFPDANKITPQDRLQIEQNQVGSTQG